MSEIHQHRPEEICWDDCPYKPQEGDRVRVVLEGDVAYLCPGGGFMLASNGIWPDQEHVVSVERIEPPVETFGPGDLLRSKRSGGLRLLALGGYVVVRSTGFADGEFLPYGQSPAIPAQDFTSKDWEKVDVE
jgi:hypothetical protein